MENTSVKAWMYRLTTVMKGKWGKRFVLLAGFVGIGLIFLSEMLPDKKVEENKEPIDRDLSAYTTQLEGRLETIVASINGVGACDVMITLENGVKYVYASEEKAGSDYLSEGEKLSQTDDSESSVILIQTENGYEGLLVTELQPSVKGVIVVCEGGGDAVVRGHVVDAVTAVLNITEKRVCVVAGNGMS